MEESLSVGYQEYRPKPFSNRKKSPFSKKREKQILVCGKGKSIQQFRYTSRSQFRVSFQLWCCNQDWHSRQIDAMEITVEALHQLIATHSSEMRSCELEVYGYSAETIDKTDF